MLKFLSSSFFVVGLLGIILILHFLALYLGWYWSLNHFDDVHHFLGGVWIASLVFWFFSAKGGSASGGKSKYHILDIKGNWLVTLILVLSVVALAGVLWEFFEFSVDRIFADRGLILYAQASLADTMADLFFDLLGGLVFVMLYRKPAL